MQTHFFPSRTMAFYMARLFLVRTFAVLAALVLVLQAHLASASMRVELKVLVVHQHVHVLVLVERHLMKAKEHLQQVVEC